MLEALHLTEGKCNNCRNPIPGIWS
jgi:hypothetical protein